VVKTLSRTPSVEHVKTKCASERGAGGGGEITETEKRG